MKLKKKGYDFLILYKPTDGSGSVSLLVAKEIQYSTGTIVP